MNRWMSLLCGRNQCLMDSLAPAADQVVQPLLLQPESAHEDCAAWNKPKGTRNGGNIQRWLQTYPNMLICFVDFGWGASLFMDNPNWAVLNILADWLKGYHVALPGS